MLSYVVVTSKGSARAPARCCGVLFIPIAQRAVVRVATRLNRRNFVVPPRRAATASALPGYAIPGGSRSVILARSSRTPYTQG